MANFTAAEWTRIHEAFSKKATQKGLPYMRTKSVVIGSFNMLKLGKLETKSEDGWKFLVNTCKRFDLLAIQEVMDNLDALKYLKKQLGGGYGMVVSDTTGTVPGDRGNTERLAFLFRWRKITRTELASDITYDRSRIINVLKKNLKEFYDTLEPQTKTPYKIPFFITFIRQPHCASFEIKSKNNASPLNFLAVNAHLLYGTNKYERLWEFYALLDWLSVRAKKETLYHDNMIMLGDCNLEFKIMDEKREEIDQHLKDLNTTVLKSKKAATANFPLLTPHPQRGELKTNARLDQTYDQIGIFSNDTRLPVPDDNYTAGTQGKDGYDYGVFNFMDLISNAIHGVNYDQIPKASEKKDLAKKVVDNISDHMPCWIRVPVPGA